MFNKSSLFNLDIVFSEILSLLTFVMTFVMIHVCEVLTEGGCNMYEMKETNTGLCFKSVCSCDRVKLNYFSVSVFD